MFSTKAWAAVEYGYGEGKERVSLTIDVTFELASDRSERERATHAGNVKTHRKMSAASSREMGGPIGADWLGNKMLFQFDSWEREARARALEALGVREFWHTDAVEEFEVLKQRLESLQGQTVHVVLG